MFLLPFIDKYALNYDMDTSILNNRGQIMTHIRQQMAVGAAIAVALVLGAHSQSQPRVLSAAMHQGVPMELCAPVGSPGRAAIADGGCVRAAGAFLEHLGNEALDVALDTAGNLIARFKQL